MPSILETLKQFQDNSFDAVLYLVFIFNTNSKFNIHYKSKTTSIIFKLYSIHKPVHSQRYPA
jgi:hypothetical protein